MPSLGRFVVEEGREGALGPRTSESSATPLHLSTVDETGGSATAWSTSLACVELSFQRCDIGLGAHGRQRYSISSRPKYVEQPGPSAGAASGWIWQRRSRWSRRMAQ